MRSVMRFEFIVLMVVLVAALAACAAASPSSGLASRGPATNTVAPTPSPLCAFWAVTHLPPSVGLSKLDAVAAIAADDVWAVGAGGVAIHWNGTAWTLYPTPSLSGPVELRGIAAISADDVWAVGAMTTSEQGTTTLIEHWNGSQWSVARTPSGTGKQNILSGVAAVASNDVWAIGVTGFYNTQPLMLHWNGSSWKRISGPPAPYESELSSITAIAHKDVWAVGSSGGSGPRTLAEHWNGSHWQIVPVPQGPTDTAALNAVAARSAKDVWAVGYSVDFPRGTSLSEHWNGTRWQVVKSPSPDSKGVNPLTVVTAVHGTNTLWAVGEQAPGVVFNDKPSATFLIEQWNGKTWKVVPGPAAPSGTGNLNGVAATPEGDVWVVGQYGLAMVHAGTSTRATLNCPMA